MSSLNSHGKEIVGSVQRVTQSCLKRFLSGEDINFTEVSKSLACDFNLVVSLAFLVLNFSSLDKVRVLDQPFQIRDP